MIFEILLNAIYTIITTLLSWVHIPELPAIDDVQFVIKQFVDNGVGILGFFANLNLLLALLGFWLSLYSAKVIYNMVMFILHKIGIK